MKYLLDLVVILIFLLCVAIGRKRGFIKMVSGILALAAALAVSSLFCAPVSEYVYDKAVEPAITKTVEAKLDEVKGTATEELDEVYESLPPIVKNLLAQTGVEDLSDLTATVPTGTNASIVDSVNEVIRPVFLPLLTALCSLLLFLITYIAASLILRMFDIVAKLPLLKQLNKTLGLVGGAVAGALWALVAVTVIQVLAALGVADGVITLQTVSETLIVNWLSGINPLGGALVGILNSATIK